jgi:hypothetical protein
VLGQYCAKDVRAETPSGKGGNENVGVETNSRETALTTSSSVRKPRASAKGITWRRTCSNWRTASWLRSANQVAGDSTPHRDHSTFRQCRLMNPS